MTTTARLNDRLIEMARGRHLPRRTVRVRLTLLYGLLFLLSGAALVGVTYVLFERATAYTPPRLPQIPHAPAIHDPRTPLGVSQFLQPIAQAQRQLAYDGHILHLSVPKNFAVGRPSGQGLGPLAQSERQLAHDQHRLAQAIDQLARAVHRMARAGTAQAAQRAADSHQLLVSSGIALGIVSVLALVAGWLVAGRMLRPIRTITRTARRISSASLHERLALDGPQDELKELGDTLDELFGRLEAAFEAQRQFVANASHELRAPLTRQRALIQVALADPEANLASLRAAHERALASERHLEQIIDGLLALTRGRAGLERREPVDLARLATEALLMRESQLAAADLDVRATLVAAPTVGDPRLLERLIANLVDNAIRHNTPSGRVELETGTRDLRAFVAIENTGPEIPPEDVARLFQPFQRLGARTQHNNGYGLGLSIVQAIADAHRADLSAYARPQGGLRVEVYLPATPVPSPDPREGPATTRSSRRPLAAGAAGLRSRTRR
jgi:signal transduction histidine kinase